MSVTVTETELPPRAVRFDNECVLIPDVVRPRKPLFVTKSYSLPLWKRKVSGSALDDLDLEDDVSNKDKVFVHIPLPRIGSNSNKPHSPLRSPQAPPCLVHRPISPTLDRKSRPTQRRPSLPLPARPHLATVPLRACCPDCLAVTERCLALKTDEEWQEHFSRGARRRRSSSLDARPGTHNPVRALPGFDDMSFPTPALRVDEVDKRRSAVAEVRRKYNLICDPPPLPAQSTSTSDAVLPSPIGPPIKEENEDELFPLPSPRRSPASTPTNSPKPSPHASNTNLAELDRHLRGSSSSSSLSSVRSTGSLRSPGAKSPLGPGHGRCERGLLTPGAGHGSPSPSPPPPVSASPDAHPNASYFDKPLTGAPDDLTPDAEPHPQRVAHSAPLPYSHPPPAPTLSPLPEDKLALLGPSLSRRTSGTLGPSLSRRASEMALRSKPSLASSPSPAPAPATVRASKRRSASFTPTPSRRAFTPALAASTSAPGGHHRRDSSESSRRSNTTWTSFFSTALRGVTAISSTGYVR